MNCMGDEQVETYTVQCVIKKRIAKKENTHTLNYLPDNTCQTPTRVSKSNSFRIAESSKLQLLLELFFFSSIWFINCNESLWHYSFTDYLNANDADPLLTAQISVTTQ